MIAFVIWLLVWLAIGFAVALAAVRPVSRVVYNICDSGYEDPRPWTIGWLIAIMILWPLALVAALFIFPVGVLGRKIDEARERPEHLTE